MKTMHLFAGAGGGIVADMMLGHTPICAVEIKPFCRQVLRQRQKDGFLPPFPIYSDVRSISGAEYKGVVDMVCGGFPCQDISSANVYAVGISGKRSGLFFELARICSDIRPRFIFLENSPRIIQRGLDTVLGTVASMGYNAEWGCLGAGETGAWHLRKRWWCLCWDTSQLAACLALASSAEDYFSKSISVADADVYNIQTDGETKLPPEGECGSGTTTGTISNASSAGEERPDQFGTIPSTTSPYWWQAEPRVGRVVNGLADRVDRLVALGNGQVPATAAIAYTILSRRILQHYNK
jgi:DNA (cytosine-5)-methyltransferase 1